VRIPIIDAHVHMDVRSANDYELMALAGVEIVIVPSTFTGIRKHSRGEYEAGFQRVIEFERRRAEAFGIRLYAGVGVDPEDLCDREAALATIECLPDYLQNKHVCALGEIGLEHFSEIEIECFRRQLRLATALRMPAIMHTPHGNKQSGLPRMLAILRQAIDEDGVDPSLLLLDDLNLEVCTSGILNNGIEFGAYGVSVSCVGPSLFLLHRKCAPDEVRKLLAEFGARRLLLNSALAWGFGDPLAIPRVLLSLRMNGVPEETLRQLAFDNAAAFFSRSRYFQP